MKPRTYRRASNSLRLDFDPVTWDALKAFARQQNESMERTAYLAIQAALRQADAPASSSTAATPTEADTGLSGISCVGVHNGKKGERFPWHAEKSQLSLTASSISF